MRNLSMVEGRLPPGFRFHPRDDELICDYLMKKVTYAYDLHPLMIEVDLNKCEPWDIPGTACVGGKEWFFYSQRDRKYATGMRTNRATDSGYWKATGKDRPVLRKGTLVGMRKTLVFYQGRAPKGQKSDWVMHEFRLEGPLGPPKLSSTKADWVLCRVFFKNREVDPKEDMMVSGSSSAGGGNTSPSSTHLSMPASSDPYISFVPNHPTTNLDDHQDEQVPCFSIFTSDQTNQTATSFSYVAHLDSNFSTKIIGSTPFGSLLDFGYYPNASSSCDKKVLNVVLDQLTEIEGNPSNIQRSSRFGEANSDCFLSEIGLSTMWNHYS